MKHHIITMATADFYQQGLALLRSWRISNADEMILYGKDFDSRQRRSFTKSGATYVDIKKMPEYSNLEMHIMYYKMVIIRDHLVKNPDINLSYLDYDTMVSQHWSHVYDQDFDVGVTVRPTARSPILNTNGGVLFVKNSEKSIKFFNWCIETILRNAQQYIKEMQLESETTDETKRSIAAETKKVIDDYRARMEPSNDEFLPIISGPELSSYRSIGEQSRVDFSRLRWWCDQLFCSAVVQEIYSTVGKPPLNDFKIEQFNDFKIGMFNCPRYNDTSEFTLKDIKRSKYLKRRFIIHFKGRRKNRVYKYLLAEMLTRKTRKRPSPNKIKHEQTT